MKYNKFKIFATFGLGLATVSALGTYTAYVNPIVAVDPRIYMMLRKIRAVKQKLVIYSKLTLKMPVVVNGKPTEELIEAATVAESISHQMSSTHFKIDTLTFVSHQISFTHFKLHLYISKLTR